MMRTGFFILIVSLLFLDNIFAQTNSSTDGSGWKLPPLQALIDSALVHSTAVKMAENNITLSEYELKKLQRDWLDYFSLNANVRYGYEPYISIWGETPLINNLNSNQNQERLYYGAGANFGIKLSQIFDRKLPRQRAKLQIEQTRLSKEQVEKNVREMVIIAYFELSSLQNTLNMKSEMLVSANMLFDQADIDYSGNKISLGEYTRAQEGLLLAQNEYELLKNTYSKAFLLMEELVGIKLNKK